MPSLKRVSADPPSKAPAKRKREENGDAVKSVRKNDDEAATAKPTKNDAVTEHSIERNREIKAAAAPVVGNAAKSAQGNPVPEAAARSARANDNNDAEITAPKSTKKEPSESSLYEFVDEFFSKADMHSTTTSDVKKAVRSHFGIEELDQKTNNLVKARLSALVEVKQFAEARLGISKNEEEPTSKRGRKKKDPNGPKLAKTAYNCYQNRIYPKLRTEFPDLSSRELQKMLGERWKMLSTEEKVEFVGMSEKDQKRYDREKREYDAKTKESATNAETKVGGATAEAANGATKAKKGRSSLPAALEIRPLNLKRFSLPSKPMKVENKVEGAKVKSSSEAILDDIEGLKCTKKKTKPQAESDDDSSHGDIWTAGLSSEKNETKDSEDGDAAAVDENCDVNRAIDSEDGGADVDENHCILVKEEDIEDGGDNFDVDMDDDGHVGNAETTEGRDGDSNDNAEGMNPLVNCNIETSDVDQQEDEDVQVDDGVKSEVHGGNSRAEAKGMDPPANRKSDANDDDCSGSESLLSTDLQPTCKDTESSEGRQSLADDKENSSPLRPPNVRRVTSSPSAAALKSPREDEQADDREGSIPREICVQQKQTLFKLVPVNPPDKSLPWTSEYPIPNEKDLFMRKTIQLLTKDEEQHAQLGRSAVTGIKSMLISRLLCTVKTWNSGGGPAASVVVHKSPSEHAVHIDGAKIESLEAVALEHGSVLALYGPTGYAYKLCISDCVPESAAAL